MSLSPELRDRILAAARATPAPTRSEIARKNAIALLFGLVPAVAVIALGIDTARRPAAYVAAVAVGWMLVAAAATWGALGRGRSMVGRPNAWLVVVAVATPLALLACAYLGYIPWPSAADADCGRFGDFKCFGFTTVAALGPLFAFVYARRNTDPVHPALTGAAIGAAAGAWAGVAIALHCPFASPMHVGLGHVVPTIVVAAVGMLVGARFVAVRGASR
jgi:hypothetical protein